MRALIVLLLLAILGAVIVSIFRINDSGKPNSLTVSASFYPLAYFAHQIGGARITVNTITPNGVEPHDYEPTTRDIIKLKASSLVLIMGDGFEPWAQRAGVLSDGAIISIEHELQSSIIQKSDRPDPHLWLSPRIAEQMTDLIQRELTRQDPKGRGVYAANALKLKQRLQLLDQSYRKELAVCETRNLITSHAAFSYLAAEYGLTQVAISGMSPEEEPSLKDLTTLVDYARSHSVHYVFVETLTSPKLAETMSREVGAQTLVLNPIEGLTDEEMKNGSDYFTIMEANLNSLRLGLLCQPTTQ